MPVCVRAANVREIQSLSNGDTMARPRLDGSQAIAYLMGQLPRGDRSFRTETPSRNSLSPQSISYPALTARWIIFRTFSHLQIVAADHGAVQHIFQNCDDYGQ